MKTIVEGIMHYTYATFHVDLMYGTDVMSPNLSKFGFFLDFSAEKMQFFVKNQGIEHLKTQACSCECLLAYKTIICLI